MIGGVWMQAVELEGGGGPEELEWGRGLCTLGACV